MKYLLISLQIILSLLLPLLAIGIIRQIKAKLQNRIGPPLMQPYFNLIKLFKKNQIFSHDSTWIFPLSSIINLSIVLILSFIVPWLPFNKSVFSGDIFFLIYLLALMRFFTIIGSIDTGSPFSSFSTSREVSLAVLLEPAIILALLALAVTFKTSDLFQIFNYAYSLDLIKIPVLILSASSLFLASVVEFSRCPVDDPTTHLELTMIHEAMIIENSGLNLAIVEYTYSLKLLLFYGLIAQCLTHCILIILNLSILLQSILCLLIIFSLLILTSLIESFSVKLSWHKVPDFIAYALTFSFLAVFAAIINGVSL